MVHTFFHYDFNDVSSRVLTYQDITDFKRKVLSEYLDDLGRMVMVNGSLVFTPNPSGVPNRMISVLGEGALMESAIGIILSSDRTYLPKDVSCTDNNYNLIESVLKQERGSDSYLSRGFLRISNDRRINYRAS